VKISISIGTSLVGVALGFATLAMCGSFTTTHAQTNISGDVSRIPRLSIMDVSTLPSNQVKISGQQAIDVIMNRFNFTEDKIDPSAGVVRAVVDVPGDTLKHDLRAWVVTVDQPLLWPLGRTMVEYHTYSLVVNANTGRYEFGYYGSPTAPGGALAEKYHAS